MGVTWVKILNERRSCGVWRRPGASQHSPETPPIGERIAFQACYEACCENTTNPDSGRNPDFQPVADRLAFRCEARVHKERKEGLHDLSHRAGQEGSQRGRQVL